MADCMDCGVRLYPDQFRRCGHCNARRLSMERANRRGEILAGRRGRALALDFIRRRVAAAGVGYGQPPEEPVSMSWPEVAAWAAASIAVAALVIARMGGVL